MSSVEYIPFCERWTEELWDQRTEAEQEVYVSQELARLEAEGSPVLRAVLACGDEWPQFLGLRLLREGIDSKGNPQVHMPQVYLRLVEPERLDWESPDGEVAKAVAVPPNHDPQGRLLQREKQGKVLVAKVGNLGGNLDPSRDASAARAFGGDRRDSNGRSGRPLYITREVTRNPQPFTFREAIFILRQWGFGIGESAFRSARAPGKDGKRERGQCMWLVEEVSTAQAAEEFMVAQAAKAKAAKAAKAQPSKE